MPLRQTLDAVAPGGSIGQALQGGRGGGQDHRDAAQLPARHRHVASMVMHPVLLLESSLVLLIDHDEAKVSEG